MRTGSFQLCQRAGAALCLLMVLGALSCTDTDELNHTGQLQDAGGLYSSELRFATGVVAVEYGPGAGFGQDRFPGVVLGPPRGAGPLGGGLDVLSLGVGGWIVLDFGEPFEDGPGPDFVVYENPFWVGGDPQHIFAELGEVAVSQDGLEWFDFPCATIPRQSEIGNSNSVSPTWPSCAGWNPVLPFETGEWDAGGDPFDLAEIGVDWARYVRILDVSEEGLAPTAGFDLDAVAVLPGR